MRPKRKSPTSHTLDLARSRGHLADVVERFIKAPKLPGGGVRKDLFGCIDIVMIADCRIVGIQCGAASGHSGHKKKCLAEPRLIEWLQTGARFLLHSWSQPKGKGTSWVLREEELRVEDFATTAELDLL